MRKQTLVSNLLVLMIWGSFLGSLSADPVDDKVKDLGFPDLVAALKATPGCLGVETAKTLAQVESAMILGFTSLDALAYPVRFTNRRILAVVDARRGEVFSATYSAVPGGVMRDSEYAVSTPDHLAADLEAVPGDVLAVGDGAILYRDVLTEQRGGRLEIASPAFAHPDAASLVELAAPRFLREEHDRLFDVAPLYLRKSDAEIAWDRRIGDA